MGWRRGQHNHAYQWLTGTDADTGRMYLPAIKVTDTQGGEHICGWAICPCGQFRWKDLPAQARYKLVERLT